MRNNLPFLLILLLPLCMEAQIKLPALSPLQKIEQTVGLSTISVEYSRPYRKGRTIFGGLETYGELWRTGANRSTKVTFSDDVLINETVVPAGTYALITRPEKSVWDIYLYEELQHWNVPDDFSMEKVKASMRVPSSTLSETIEMLTISVENITPFSADLVIKWENTQVALPIQMTTSSLIDAQIEDRLAGPDMGDYYLAAKFKLLEGKDLNQATEWIKKSIALSMDEPVFWTYQLLAEIELARGNKHDALESAQRALEIAESGENNAFWLAQIQELMKNIERLP